MGNRTNKSRNVTSLSSGRANVITKSSSQRLSSSTTRQIIRKYHNLKKQLNKAVDSNDKKTAAAIQAELDASGGLSRYQEASKLGQSHDRGGDSSRELMRWFSEDLPVLKECIAKERHGNRFRMLEVGALRVDNACAKSGIFDVVRIDLNSQSSEILKQDFMERPLPTSEDEKFDIISLSLVLNFVPNEVNRGDMLKRVAQFLRRASSGDSDKELTAARFPSLFLVLPAPCVQNSRYLDGDKLLEMMEHLGYTLLFHKMSSKLAYYLWLSRVQPPSKSIASNKSFARKIQVNPGHNRNNFAILLA